MLHHSDLCSEPYFINMTCVWTDSFLNDEGLQTIMTAVYHGFSQLLYEVYYI
jgi:hypothetical protein